MKKVLAFLVSMAMLLGCVSFAAAETDKPTLRVLVQLHELTKDPSELPQLQELADMANVNVEWTVVRSGWDEKKAVMLASGDLPDVILTGGFSDGDIMQNSEYFVKLNDYIDDMPNVSAMFEKNPALRNAATQLDGSIYSLPSEGAYRPETLGIMFINQQWLKNLNLEMPTTLEELKNVLIAFRDDDPNGNGIKDEIPLDSYEIDYSGLYNCLNLLGSFGITDAMENVYVDDNGKCDMIYHTEGYKKLVSYLHDLWSEGLINSESFTQDYTMFQANAQNPEIATVGVTFGWSTANRVGTQWLDQYTTLGPLSSEEGQAAYWDRHEYAWKIDSNKCAIFSSCSDIPAALRLIDACYSEKMSIELRFGAVGQCFEMKDGQYVMLSPTDDSDADRWAWINSLCTNAPFYFDSEIEAKILALPDYSDRMNEDAVYLDHLRDAKTCYPGIAKMDTETISELTLLLADINNYTHTKYAEWVTTGGIEDQWDDYLKQLDAMQIGRVNEIYQNAYDTFQASLQ